MIIGDKEAKISYRCNSCGAFVSGVAGIFSLSADMVRLKCPCGCSEAEISYTKDKKIRVKIPCIACPKPHSYTLSPAVFFNKDLFALSCPYSGIDIGFIGKEKSVNRAVKEADEILKGFFDAAGIDGFPANNNEEEQIFSDPQILEIVNFVVNDLSVSGEITCRCEEDEGKYSAEVTDEGVVVQCDICKAKKLIPITSTLAARDFLDCMHLDLE